MYDQIQNLLTVTINIVAIAGFTGIIAHALYSWHLSQIPAAPQRHPNYQRSELVDEILQAMPTVEPLLQEEVPTESEATAQMEETNTSLEPQQPADEQEETDLPKQIDLNNLDAVTLRKLCTQHQIAWRNFKGANRHMPKATMIFNLQQRLTA
jgi:hypothetical protein